PGLLVPGAARPRLPLRRRGGLRDRRPYLGRAAGAPPFPPGVAGGPARRRRLRRRAPALPAGAAVAGRGGGQARGGALVCLADRLAGARRQPSSRARGDHGLQRLSRLVRAADRGVRPGGSANSERVGAEALTTPALP